MLRIKAKKDGFWRCGVQHSATPTDYPDDRFTPEERERLKREPWLEVTELPDPPGSPEPEKRETGAAAKKAAGKRAKHPAPGESPAPDARDRDLDPTA